MTSSDSLKAQKDCWVKIMELNKNCRRLLIVVCVNDETFKDLNDFLWNDAIRKTWRNKVIIVSKNGTGVDDRPAFNDLSSPCKENLLSKEILFQGIKKSLKTLIGEDLPEDVIDLASMKELMEGKEVTIPSFSTSRFDPSLYVERNLSFSAPFDDKFWDDLSTDLGCKTQQLKREIQIDSNGKIEWLVDDERKLKIWGEILKKTPGCSKNISEDELINNSKRSTVIISGVAGTGKSTALSQYYSKIKEIDPNCLVVRINLVEQAKTILKIDFDPDDRSCVVNFFTNLFPVMKSSPLARSLLQHRIETAGHLIVMFDGFDEISFQIQEKVINLMKAISLTKIERLYITTRPHLNDKLQNEMCQFSYALDNFSENDQTNYLYKYWKINLPTDEDEIIREFARSLVGRISKILNDNERSFIGIPLQCHILAMCFKSDLKMLIDNRTVEAATIVDYIEKTVQNFNLVSLYNLFMDKKRQVLREEKTCAPALNTIMDSAIDILIDKIESHLTKLAVETLVRDQKTRELFWPPSSSYKSPALRAKKDIAISECALKYGLVYKDGMDAKINFLHRTFAEYLFAKYLYEGFLLDHDIKHNRLLEKEEIREFFSNKIMVDDTYDGIRVFLDGMMKEIVDNEEWRNLIDRRHELPTRLQTFAIDTSASIKQETDVHRPTWSYKLTARTVPYKSANIFKFIFDCLDAMIVKAEIRKYLISTVDCRFEFFQEFHYQRSDLLKRCLDYYDDAEDSEVTGVLEKMFGLNGPFSSIGDSNRNKNEGKQNAKLLFVFMGKHRNIWKGMQKREKFDSSIVQFFICNEDYDGLLEQYLELLSWLYDDDSTSFVAPAGTRTSFRCR